MSKEEIQNGPRLRWWQVTAGMLLSWLGLAGFADNVVEWRDWFQIGVIDHWRAITGFLADRVQALTGLRVPDSVFDYLTIGVAVSRSVFSALWQMADDGRWGKVAELDARLFLYLALLKLVQIVIWPTYLLALIYTFLRYRRAQYPADRRRKYVLSAHALRLLGITLLLFIPILFVASDLAYTLGLIARPG